MHVPLLGVDVQEMIAEAADALELLAANTAIAIVLELSFSFSNPSCWQDIIQSNIPILIVDWIKVNNPLVILLFILFSC